MPIDRIRVSGHGASSDMTPRALQAQEPLQAEADVLPHQSAGPEEFQNGADADGGFCFPRQSGRRPAPTLTTALPAAASPSSRSSWRPCTRPDRTQPAPGFTIGFDGERDRPPLAAPRVSGDQQALGRPLHERHCSDVDGRVETAAFHFLLAAARVVASDLDGPGFRAEYDSCSAAGQTRRDALAGLAERLAGRSVIASWIRRRDGRSL